MLVHDVDFETSFSYATMVYLSCKAIQRGGR